MKEKIKPDFLIIPFEVIEKSQHLEAKVYGVIYWLAKLKEGKCIASNKYISNTCSCTNGSVRNALTNLEKKGFIKRTYKDKEKNLRDEIIPLVTFSGVSSTDYRVSLDNDRGVSSDNAHISKSNLNKNTTEKISEDYSQIKETKKLLSGKRKDYKIIGYYFNRRKMKMPTKVVFVKELKRALAETKTLKYFDSDKIKKAFDYAEQHYPEWTIETVGKVITKI